MSCGGVSELVIDRRGAGGGGAGAGGGNGGSGNSGSVAASCRLRGTTSNSTPAKGAPATGAGAATGAQGIPATTAATAATQPQHVRPPKPCCFCWCCCCSCSCLAVKNVDENGPTKNLNNSDLLNCDGEPPPTLEEIRSWGKSFDKLMRSSAGRKVFRDFLRCEYSEENILFWLACEELKRETNPDVVEEKARKIYEDYISILSPKEVSLDSRVREIVNRNMVEPTPHTFDEAQLQIYTLMHRDSYPRFVNSGLYKTLAQLNSAAASDADSGDADAGAINVKTSTTTTTTATTTMVDATSTASTSITVTTAAITPITKTGGNSG